MDSKAIIGMYNWLETNSHAVGFEITMVDRNSDVIFSDTLLSLSDWQNFIECDAVLLFGTWGSTHPDRQLTPTKNTDFSSVKRQAYLEYINKSMVDLCKKYKKPMIVLETATYSRVRANHLSSLHFKSTKPRYYRMGINHWTWSRTTWCDPSMDDGNRDEIFYQKFEQNNNNIFPVSKRRWNHNRKGAVYIVAGLEHDPTSNESIDRWIQKSIRKIQQHTSKQIVVRPHPLSKLDYDELLQEFDPKKVSYTKMDTQHSLLEESKNMYCAVVDSSTSVFELLDIGIPVFCTEHSFAAPFGNTDLSRIDKPVLKDKKFYSQWVKQMCYTEFSLGEYTEGQIFKYIRKLLDKYYSQ